MARTSYIIRRGATYHARLKIPLDLVELIGRKELTKSLGTKEEAEAKRRVFRVVEAWNLEFDDLRSRRDITADDKADATWSHYSGTLDRDDQSRRHLPKQSQIDAAKADLIAQAERGEIKAASPLAMIGATLDLEVMRGQREYEANNRRVKLATLRKHLGSGETALIAHEVDRYVVDNKLIVEPGSDTYQDIAHRMMRAEIEALERTAERDRGDYSGAPRDPIVKPMIGKARERAKAGESIMDLFAIYDRENPKQIAQDTLNQARRDIGLFVNYVGASCPVHRIDKKAVREWKHLLMRYPVKASESKAFAGMNLAQTVKANETIGKPTLTPRTVNRYIASLGAFCTWLVAHGYLDTVPTRDMSLSKSKGKPARPFAPAELQALFASPLFVGCQSADEWRNIAKPGNVQVRDHRFWLPLVMLYTGARPAEIAQLNTNDVRQEHDQWIFHVTTEGGGEKSVKTAGSMRVIPVHSELVRLGFIEYRNRIEREGQIRLFPEAKRNSRGQMVADLSREFGRYLTRIGLKDGRGLSLYSFRHGTADALRRAGHLDEAFGFILGHTAGTMTGRYGTLPQGMLQQRVELIEAIAYPGLDFSHLKMER